MSQKKIVLVGGGTGGHFFPLIAIAESLRDIDTDISLHYFGPAKYDKASLAELSISHTYIPAGKLRRYFSPLNIVDLFKTFFGFIIACVSLYIVYPDVVMSKGGYTSVPVVLAAYLLRIPIITHESDTKLGLANKIGIRLSKKTVITFDEVRKSIHQDEASLYTFGIPVRKVLLTPPSPHALEALGVHGSRPLILVLGGSQGAERLNQFIINALNELLPHYSVIHQTGPANIDSVKSTVENLLTDEELRAHYHPVPFLNQAMLNDAYHLSQIVISRAGSTSIYEVALHGKPSILIPIPESISHDQRTNAYTYAKSGAAIVMEEENISDDLLKAEIDRIMSNNQVYDGMARAAQSFGKRDAADNTAKLIMEIAQTHDT